MVPRFTMWVANLYFKYHEVITEQLITEYKIHISHLIFETISKLWLFRPPLFAHNALSFRTRVRFLWTHKYFWLRRINNCEKSKQVVCAKLQQECSRLSCQFSLVSYVFFIFGQNGNIVTGSFVAFHRYQQILYSVISWIRFSVKLRRVIF